MNAAQKCASTRRSLPCTGSPRLSAVEARVLGAIDHLDARPHRLRGRRCSIRGTASGVRRACRSACAPRTTKPGTHHALTLVPAIRKPWITSGLVARMTTCVSVGTTMHCGTNEYCCASTRTDGRAVRLHRRAEVGFDELARQVQPAGVDGLDVRRRLRGPVQAAEDDDREDEGDDAGDDVGPAAFEAIDDCLRARGWPAQPTAPRGRKTKKKKATRSPAARPPPSPATATAPRGPPATICCNSSALPFSRATFSLRNAAETWLGTSVRVQTSRT